MLHTGSIWLLVAAFFGAGLFNAIGTPATQNSFVRWGYPAWWCRVTGGLEMANVVLIALPVTRGVGLILGAVIIAAAVLTVLRHREFSHLAPLGLLVALLVLAEVGSLTSGSFQAIWIGSRTASNGAEAADRAFPRTNTYRDLVLHIRQDVRTELGFPKTR